MKITYRKSTGEVVMRGQEINNDKLETVTVKKDKRMDDGYKMFYHNGRLEYEKTPVIEEREKAEEADRLIADIMQAGTIEELKPLLIKILKDN